MKRKAPKWRRGLVAIIVCLLPIAYCLLPTNSYPLPTANCLHKFHATIAQLEYNAKEQSVEAVIRFFADDFETAISQHAKREIKFNTPQALKDRANTEAVFSYVRDRFELKGKNGNPVKLAWVGMELQAEMVWVYFEGKLPGGLGGAQLRNRVMQELFDDQVNIVNFKFDGKQTGTMFNLQDGFKLVPDKK